MRRWSNIQLGLVTVALFARVTPTSGPFQEAIRHGDVARVKQLLEKNPGAIAAREETTLMTLLHFAADSGRAEIVELLLELKADINARDAEGSTPLHHAARSKRDRNKYASGVIDLLVDRGAEVNARDNTGYTALMLAAQQRDKQNVERLLAREADAKARDNNGDTALHWAAWTGQMEIARLLLAKGAEINVKNKRGETPLQLAANAKVADALRKAGAKE